MKRKVSPLKNTNEEKGFPLKNTNEKKGFPLEKLNTFYFCKAYILQGQPILDGTALLFGMRDCNMDSASPNLW